MNCESAYDFFLLSCRDLNWIQQIKKFTLILYLTSFLIFPSKVNQLFCCTKKWKIIKFIWRKTKLKNENWNKNGIFKTGIFQQKCQQIIFQTKNKQNSRHLSYVSECFGWNRWGFSFIKNVTTTIMIKSSQSEKQCQAR